MGKAKRDLKKKPVPPEEKDRLRALKLVGHDSLIGHDEYGRDRVVASAVAMRDYDIGSGKSTVRVRNIDPLIGLTSLSWQQKKAGAMYREDYDICEREGVKPVSWDLRVDGSSAGKSMPERVMDAHNNLSSAIEAMGYGQIAQVVERVCGQGMAIAELARMDRPAPGSRFTQQDMIANTPMRRESITLLLSMGLQRLAVHYGIVAHPKRVDR